MMIPLDPFLIGNASARKLANDKLLIILCKFLQFLNTATSTTHEAFLLQYDDEFSFCMPCSDKVTPCKRILQIKKIERANPSSFLYVSSNFSVIDRNTKRFHHAHEILVDKGGKKHRRQENSMKKITCKLAVELLFPSK